LQIELREKEQTRVTASVSALPGYAVEINGLTKYFSHNLALRGIDLNVSEKEFLTILGPNGAGKTTLLRVIAVLTRPSSGSVRVAGFELGKESAEIRHHIGYVPHQTLLYDDLTAYENLKFYGRMYDVPNLEQRILALAEEMALSSHLHKLVHTLSRGMQQRFSIMRALLHDPSLLLLDEPETGLDKHARSTLGELIGIGTRTIIMSSHRLESALELGHRVAILASGRIKYDEPVKSLNASDLALAYDQCTEGI
jgi:ABC-type multidrug transport system ATPase subunit